MDLELNLTGFLILILMLYFCLTRPRLKFSPERVFLHLVGISILGFSIGMISSSIVHRTTVFDGILLSFLYKTYNASHVWTSAVMLAYIMSLVFDDMDFELHYMTTVLISFSVSVFVYILPFYMRNSQGGIVTFGASQDLAHAASALAVLSGIVMLCANKGLFAPRYFSTLLFSLLVWGLCILMYFAAGFQIVTAGACFSILLVFFSMENPEVNLDRETGFFNSPSFSFFLKRIYLKKKPFSLILINMDEHNVSGVSGAQVDSCRDEIIRFIRSLPSVRVFRIRTKEYGMIFRNAGQMEDACLTIRSKFDYGFFNRRGEKIVFRPLIVKVPYSEVTKDGDAMMEILSFAVNNGRQYTDSLEILIDYEFAKEPQKTAAIQKIVMDSIKEDRVEAFFQPIYSTHSKKFFSAEVLTRIRDRNGRLIFPDAFIPVIEATGNIVTFGEIIFEKACKFYHDNDTDALGIEYIEVNLSTVQLEQENLADRLISIMEKWKVRPSFINLEITETGSLLKVDVTKANMMKLIAYGVSFSLDDFGSGASNLEYIINMPVSIIKYDKNMTQSYFSNEKSRAVIPYVTRMAHEMGLKVVGEGIETQEQLATMESFGIDYIQGYYFCRPVSEKDYVEFVRKSLERQDAEQGDEK